MTDPLVPINTPFRYNVGINYESWENGRTGRSITADLNQITQYFGLIKTFHDVAVGTANPSNPQIDPTQQEVISYLAKTSNVDLVMGTLNSALAQGGFGSPWQPGLMTSSVYTDKWVQMIIKAFGSKQAVQSHLKMILLGNEIDQNGPPPNDPSFNSYKGWINQSFDNLSASLKKAGLGSIPVSTTIANYGPTNAVAVSATAYIEQHWSKAWDGGKPIVLFNQYTPGPPNAPMSGTDYSPVINYFESVYTQLKGGVEPFVGETGYSSFYGQANQITVYKQISAWLTGQYKNGHKTVPLFAFDAFDQPSRTPPFEVKFGIFGQNGSFKPTGLKPGLTLPAWFKTPISNSGNDRLSLFSGVFAEGMTVNGGAGTDSLVLAEPTTVDFVRGKLVDIERLKGSSGDDAVRMTASQLLALQSVNLDQGSDLLRVIVNGTFGFMPDAPILAGIETLDLIGSGQMSLVHLGPDTALTISGPHVTVGETLGYAGSFSVVRDSEVTIEADNVLILSGGASFVHSTVNGEGRLRTMGGTTVNGVTLGGTVQWFNSGFLAQIGGDLTIGDGAGNVATFNNLSSGVFGLVGDVDIEGGTGASTFMNQGLLAKTSGGSSEIAVAVVNIGMIEASNGALDLQQGVTGPGGILKIDASGTIEIDGAVSGQTVDFEGDGGQLILSDVAHFRGRLEDFGAGDQLDLRQFDPLTTTVAFRESDPNTAGVLTVTDGSIQARFVLLGQYAASAFATSADGSGGTIVSYTPPASDLALAPQPMIS